MKATTVNVLIVCALLSAGCVTEGELNFEAAPAEEQAQVNLTLGVRYLQQGRPDAAIEALQRALDQQPRLAEAHSAIAIAYDQTGETDLADDHHRRATQLAPRNANLQDAYAVFLCLHDRWDEAEPHFQRALDNMGNANPVSVMNNAGTCAAGAGDLEAAERFFRAALGIEGENLDALRGMIDVSIRSENYLQGRAFWQRLERIAPVQADDLLSCYLIENGMGAAAAAADCADRLRTEFPGSPALAQLRELERDGN
jgi:type IV pilus assembly protein PilF